MTLPPLSTALLGLSLVPFASAWAQEEDAALNDIDAYGVYGGTVLQTVENDPEAKEGDAFVISHTEALEEVGVAWMSAAQIASDIAGAAESFAGASRSRPTMTG